jgi:hypothetical protein
VSKARTTWPHIEKVVVKDDSHRKDDLFDSIRPVLTSQPSVVQEELADAMLPRPKSIDIMFGNAPTAARTIRNGLVGPVEQLDVDSISRSVG